MHAETQAQALKRLEASVVVPVDFLRVPKAAVVGYYAYGEAIDLWVFLGGGIILLSNFQAVLAEKRKAEVTASLGSPLVR